MATGRSRKKNKFKVSSKAFDNHAELTFFSSNFQLNERSASSVRDKYSNDPAFTDDISHLALPLRRNSGEEAAFAKMFGSKKKSKSKDDSTHYSLRMERKKKSQANNHSAEYLCRNTSSSESLENIIKGGRKGFSLDRSFENDAKPQMKPKRSSWFLRDKNREKQSSKNEKFFKRASLDFSVAYDTKQVVDNNAKPRSRAKTIYRQNAADYTGDSSTTPQEEIPDPIKKLSKFQIGKRFLKGEIGIRSFNYYLLKEGLKKSGSTKQKAPEKTPFMSKSEENIYEEIFFNDQPKNKPQTPLQPPNLPPPNKHAQQVNANDENCLNCEICLQEAQEKHHKMQSCDKCVGGDQRHQQKQTVVLAPEGCYATVTRKLDNATIYDFFQQQSPSAVGGNGILQFQSYNPNNPNVYKIETTPVAFSDYNLTVEEQLYQQHYAALIALQQLQQQQQQNYSGDGKIMTKSSSSNDSIRQRQHEAANEFYTRPNYIYPTNTIMVAEQKLSSSMRRDKKSSIYKTDSSNSLRSENSLNRNSQKSNQNSNNRDDMQMRQDMSDSSLGDSLFSSDANKRYFGSSESCRFNYECGGRRRRRCSLEENEKCSFSDTCRNYETECNLRNCDCSSSYFSSDFDDTNNIYGTNNNGGRSVKSYHGNNNNNNNHMDMSKSHYGEDFIKHVSNVKRRSQNIAYDGSNNALISTSIYEVPKANPKRLDMMVDTISMRGNNNNNEHDEMAIREKLTLVENNKNKLNTGTVPKLSISSNDSKKSSTSHRSATQKLALKDLSRSQLNNEDVTLGSEISTSAQSNIEKKMIAVDIKKQPHGIKAENDTTMPQKVLKNEQPKIVVVADDNDDDEVFMTTSITVSSEEKAHVTSSEVS